MSLTTFVKMSTYYNQEGDSDLHLQIQSEKKCVNVICYIEKHNFVGGKYER